MSRDLVENIRRGRKAIDIAKAKGVDTSEWESRLQDLVAEASLEADGGDGFEPWVLWEWRRVSIPQWRQILKESIAKGDYRRGEYARWMLRDVLLDPEFREVGQ